MFKIAICDDKQITCSDVENIILTYSKCIDERMEIEVFYTGEELLKFIQNGYEFDLIFLDIEMKLLDGVTVGRKIREESDDETMQIVYMSEKYNCLMDLFNVRPMGFLKKPIIANKTIEYVRSAMKLLNKFGSMFSYQKGYEIYKIPVENIIYFESIDRKIKIVSTKGEDMFYGKLYKIFSQVAKYRFLQIHRSYIINYAHVIRLKYEQVVMSNFACLPISQSRRKEIRKRICDSLKVSINKSVHCH